MVVEGEKMLNGFLHELSSSVDIMSIVLENGLVVIGDGRTIKDATLVVEGSRIVELGAGVKPPHDAKKIHDCTGKTIMPGLMDCHAHLFSVLELGGQPEIETRAMLGARDARTLLRAGFTTVKDAGTFNYLNVKLRDAINTGWLVGPRIQTCGVVTMTGGHMWQMGAIEADGADEFRKAARTHLKNGVDLVKVCASGGGATPISPVAAPSATVEEMQAAFEEAHKFGKRTCVHCYSAQGIKNSIEAGVDMIDHGSLMDDECIRLMAAKGVYWCGPTLAMRLIREAKWPYSKERGLPEFRYKKSMELLDYIRSYQPLRKALEAGVKIANGADFSGSRQEGVPFPANAMELEALVKFGMTPMQAITAATKTASECLGVSSELGTLEVGKLADILVVDGDLTREITLLQNRSKIPLVLKGGEQVL